MDELVAYVLIENKPYALDLCITPLNIEQIYKDIIESVIEEIGSDIEFKVIYAKYKRLKFKNIELYCFFKLLYFKDVIEKRQQEFIKNFGIQTYMLIMPEMIEEETKEFDNILKKYNFEENQH